MTNNPQEVMPQPTLGRCDFKQYEHCGPHERIPEVGQRFPPFGCKNWKPVLDSEPDPEKLQDTVGELIAQAMTEFWEKP